jgi:hypothetical protein
VIGAIAAHQVFVQMLPLSGVRMGAQLLSIEGIQVKLEVTIDLSRSMLASEENIQQTLKNLLCKGGF